MPTTPAASMRPWLSATEFCWIYDERLWVRHASMRPWLSATEFGDPWLSKRTSAICGFNEAVAFSHGIPALRQWPLCPGRAGASMRPWLSATEFSTSGKLREPIEHGASMRPWLSATEFAGHARPGCRLARGASMRPWLSATEFTPGITLGASLPRKASMRPWLSATEFNRRALPPARNVIELQ